jgi:hypothetical protein
MAGKQRYPTEVGMSGWVGSEERETIADLPTYADDFPPDVDCDWCGSPTGDVCTCSMRQPNLSPLKARWVNASFPVKGEPGPPLKRVLVNRTRRRWRW